MPGHTPTGENPSHRFFFRSGAQLLCALVFLHLVVWPGERDFFAGKVSIGLPGYAGILLLLAAVVVARVFPGLFALVLRGMVPCGLAFISLLNAILLRSLYLWVEILAGFAAWLMWVFQTRIVGTTGRFDRIFLVVNHLALLLLFADWHLFGILHTHLNRSHLWWLRFPTLFKQGGVDVVELAGILGAALLASFGLVWLVGRDAGSATGRRIRLSGIAPVAAVLICAMVQWGSFDLLVESQDLGEYLRMRGESIDLPIPLPRTMKTGLGEAAGEALGKVDPRLAATDPAFSWTGDAARKTVIFLVVESWRRDLGWSEMPLLRAAASEALRFSNHHSNANSSSIAFFSLFRGVPPLRFVDFDPRFRSIQFTEFLKRSGYLTRYYFSGYVDSALPIPEDEVLLLNQKGTWCDRDAAALDAIASLAADPAPKFLMSLLFSSHFPYAYPKEYARWSDDPSQEPELLFRNRYRNCMGYLDAQLERFRQRLKESGVDRRAVVVLIGDHGEGLGEQTMHGPFFTHSNTFHTRLFEVPFMIWAPNVPGRVIDQLSCHLDVLPTLGGLMGFRSNSIWGRNLLEAAPHNGDGGGIPLFNWSAPARVAWRKGDGQTVFRVPASGDLEWMITTDAAYDLPPAVKSLYTPDGLPLLGRRIASDAAELRRFLNGR